jgi:hypothetical protein
MFVDGAERRNELLGARRIELVEGNTVSRSVMPAGLSVSPAERSVTPPLSVLMKMR